MEQERDEASETTRSRADAQISNLDTERTSDTAAITANGAGAELTGAPCDVGHEIQTLDTEAQTTGHSHKRFILKSVRRVFYGCVKSDRKNPYKPESNGPPRCRIPALLRLLPQRKCPYNVMQKHKRHKQNKIFSWGKSFKHSAPRCYLQITENNLKNARRQDRLLKCPYVKV